MKLEKCAITGTLLAWLKHYMQEHYQTVAINGQISTCSLLVGAVPQGFVHGPMLFLIYLNDMTHVVKHCQIRIFADDMSLFLR